MSEVIFGETPSAAPVCAERGKTATMPKHVAIIMDGNGRWAKMRGKERSFGHKKGSERVSEIINEAYKNGIFALSLYCLSHENLARPEEEVGNLIKLLDSGIKKEGKRAVKNGVRFVVSGDKSILSEKSQKSISDLEKQSENCAAHVLNLCFNYGSRQELCRAAENMIKAGETHITPEVFDKYLYTRYLLKEFEAAPRSIWESNMFGKSLYELVSEGVTAKIMRMPDDARQKLTKTLGRMINENTGGMICILL